MSLIKLKRDSSSIKCCYSRSREITKRYAKLSFINVGCKLSYVDELVCKFLKRKSNKVTDVLNWEMFLKYKELIFHYKLILYGSELETCPIFIVCYILEGGLPVPL